MPLADGNGSADEAGDVRLVAAIFMVPTNEERDEHLRDVRPFLVSNSLPVGSLACAGLNKFVQLALRVRWAKTGRWSLMPP